MNSLGEGLKKKSLKLQTLSEVLRPPPPYGNFRHILKFFKLHFVTLNAVIQQKMHFNI